MKLPSLSLTLAWSHERFTRAYQLPRTRKKKKKKILKNWFRVYSHFCQQKRSGNVDLKRKQWTPAAISYCVCLAHYKWVQFEWSWRKMLLQQDWLESAGKCCDWVCSGTDQLYWRLMPVNLTSLIYLTTNKEVQHGSLFMKLVIHAVILFWPKG